MTIFELEGFNPDYVQANQVSYSLLDDIVGRRKQIEAQTGFILNILNQVNPDHIIEIGTHTAHFCYLACLWKPGVRIDTFDVREKYRRYVTNVKACTGNNNVFFHLDNIHYFFYHDQEAKPTFTWIDGDHSYEAVLRDLTNAKLYNIEHMVCDDYRHVKDVNQAVRAFLNNNKDYKKVCESPEEDDRGIVYVKKV